MNIWVIVALYWIVCCVFGICACTYKRTSGLSQNDEAKDYLLGASAHRPI